MNRLSSALCFDWLVRASLLCFSASLLVIGACANADWSAVPLVPVKVHVGGVAIEVLLPEGMKLEGDGTFVVFIPDVQDPIGLPYFVFRIETFGVTKSADDIRLVGTNYKLEAIRREAIADGYLAVGQTADQHHVMVVVVKPLADGRGMNCQARQSANDGVPNPAATLAMFEKVCTSMKVPGAAPRPAQAEKSAVEPAAKAP